MSKLDVLIRRITETENALCKEMEQEEAIEFLKAYDEHIKDQQKYILTEQNKVKELYKNVKKRHNISNKYSQTRKNSF